MTRQIVKEYTKDIQSGSSYEIGPTGTKVTKVVKDNYEIISNDDFLHVRGTRRQTVDEGVRIRCNATEDFAIVIV